MDKVVDIFLHGRLGKAVGKEHWKLNVESPAEALYAINIMSKDSIRKFFLKPLNGYAKYRVLINDREIPFLYDENFFKNNELLIKSNDFKKLDIIPVLEGAFLFPIIGVALGAIGLLYFTSPVMIMASVALLLAGVSALLSKPPKMPDQRQISNPSSDPSLLANSYLFNGPINILNEGGPVPLGYGRLIIGSQVIMTSSRIQYINVKDAGRRI